MFVGEGPGADEDAQGEPFVGRAGQLLNNMIKAMGIEREQVYIANIVKCRPPGNRTPEREECATCSPFLMRQIAVIKPKVIVALGAVAAKTLLAMNASMMQLRGRFYDFRPAGFRNNDRSNDPNWDGCKLAVTYHPAFLLRDPRQKGEAWKDLQMVMKELGMKAPEECKHVGKDLQLSRTSNLGIMSNLAGLNPFADPASLGDSQIVIVLQIEPKLRGQAEVLPQANGRFGTNGPVFPHAPHRCPEN